MRSPRTLVAPAALAVLVACAGATHPASTELDQTAADGGLEAGADGGAGEASADRGGLSPELVLVVSVDWEGRDLAEQNLAAMEAFRARFPKIPLTQFLNAAYYTKPGAVAATVTERVRRGLGSQDELGLHIHGWKQLFEAAGVTFRTAPSVWGEGQPLSGDCAFDCGHEVAISGYTEDELRKVIRFSVDTLAAHGFGRAQSFRCGAWMARENVRGALAAEGITRDGSAVHTPWLEPKLGFAPVYGWLDEMWAGTTATAQPYVLETAHGPLLEIPDNGALADYTTPADLAKLFEENLAFARSQDPPRSVVNVGFHEESAARFLPDLVVGLEALYARAASEGFVVTPVVMADLAPKAP